MSATTMTRPETPQAARHRIIDCDIHPTVRSLSQLHPYLPARWREHLDTFGQRFRQTFVGSTAYPKASPALSRRDAWPPNGGPPGSDLDFMRKQHLDAHQIDVGMLFPLFPRALDERNIEFAHTFCRAINDWQVAEWATPEPRLKATIEVMAEDAEGAVAEIERCAGNPAFAQIAMATRAIEPLGRRRYWPIYAAAERLGLPLGLHTSGNNGHAVTAGGAPSYYFEEHQATSMSLHAMVASLIIEGVFERFPGLKVVVVEAGFAWVPALGWRMDRHWEQFRKEVPHLRHPPSHFLRTNLWWTTQPMEEPEQPQHLRSMLDWMGWDRVLFATDYPHWDYDDPRYAFRIPLSEQERHRVFAGNAEAVYGDRLR